MNRMDSFEALDAAKILADLALTAMPVSLHIAQDTDSTQDDALAAATPEQGCAIFLAEQSVRRRRCRKAHKLPSLNKAAARWVCFASCRRTDRR